MSRKINLQGQRFGRLFVLEEAGHNKNGRVLWKCQCDCGNQTIVRSSSLRNGDTKSCGCLQKEQTSKASKIDLTGQRFGRFLVVEEVGRNKNGYVLWKCLCDCGVIRIVCTASLRSGQTKSCGCYKKERTSEIHKVDLTGQRFGKLVVLQEAGRGKKGQVLWKCLCGCGAIKIIIGDNLRNGNTKSCGCLKREKASKARKIDLIGQRFERLLVIEEIGRNKYGKTLWKCQCDCGAIKIVSTGSLRGGYTKSCGCLQKEKASEAMKDKIFSIEHRRNISKGAKKRLENPEDHPNWKGGKTPFYLQIRTLVERSIHWAQKVLERDNYTCQRCGSTKSGSLNAHHLIRLCDILRFYNINTIEEAKVCELLFDISNGITLCKKCHRWVHSNKNIKKEFLRVQKELEKFKNI